MCYEVQSVHVGSALCTLHILCMYTFFERHKFLYLSHSNELVVHVAQADVIILHYTGAYISTEANCPYQFKYQAHFSRNFTWGEASLFFLIHNIPPGTTMTSQMMIPLHFPSPHWSPTTVTPSIRIFSLQFDQIYLNIRSYDNQQIVDEQIS